MKMIHSAPIKNVQEGNDQEMATRCAVKHIATFAKVAVIAMTLSISNTKQGSGQDSFCIKVARKRMQSSR